jgi:hypothetical protein
MRNSTLHSTLLLTLVAAGLATAAPAFALCPQGDICIRPIKPVAPPPVAPPPVTPPPVTPPVTIYPITSYIYPNYYVASLAYAAPGNGSTVTYGDQSTMTSTTATADLFKDSTRYSYSVSIVGNGVGLAASFGAGSSDGRSFSLSKTAGSIVTVQSTVDPLDHYNDTFYVVTDPVVELSQAYATAPIVATLSTIDGPGNVVTLTVGELKAPSSILAWKQEYLTALAPADYTAILALDPLVTANPWIGVIGVTLSAPDSNRYGYVGQLQVNGPDAAGDPIDGDGFILSNSATNGMSFGASVDTSVTATYSAGFKFFGLLNAGVSGSETWDWSHTSTTTHTSGTTEMAQALLKTTTVGYHATYNVYYDSLYSTFAFASPPLVSLE